MLNLALMKATAPDAKGANAQRDMMVAWANRMLTDLDRWLEDREFVATDTFTVADILMPLVLKIVEDDSLFEPYVHVQKYRERCLSRAAWRRTFESYCARVEAA
jgi:glutathione S-transferase